jgi:hypothetical protein
MRKIALILLPLVAACGSQNSPQEAADEDTSASLEAEDLAPSAAGTDPAQLQSLIDRAMPAVLQNPGEAEYRNVRPGAGGSVCGEVAPKEPKGPVFRPFVVTPEAIAVVGTSPRVAFENPEDFLADAWIRWCATPEELKQLSDNLPKLTRKVQQTSEADLPPLDIEDIPLPPPAAQPGTETPPAPPAKAKPADPPRIDSFFNSVAR